MHQRLGKVISLCAAALGNYFNGHQTKSLLICRSMLCLWRKALRRFIHFLFFLCKLKPKNLLGVNPAETIFSLHLLVA